MGVSVLLVAAALALAQDPRATVAGQVRDAESGAPLAGATVLLSDLGRATTTDEAGRYLLRDVPPGPQHLTVRLIGHAPRTLHALVPATGQLRLDITLRARAVQLTAVEVRAPLRVPGLEPGQPLPWPDREVSAAVFRYHPLLAEPDAFQALAGGETAMRLEAPGGIHIRGGASDHTGFVLDGIPVLSPYHAAGVFSAWTPEALTAVQLAAAEPPLGTPAALSGAIQGVTRQPGSQLVTQGSVSSSQLRLTFDGPLGGGAGFVLSARRGFPGILAPKSEPSYVQGRTGDGLAKLEFGLLSGQARLLGYLADNDLDAAAASTEDPGATDARHRFRWSSGSLGAEWRSAARRGEIRLLAWHAASDADADWAADSAGAALDAERRDLGFQAAWRVGPPAPGGTDLGLRFERIRTSYHVAPDEAGAEPTALDASTPVLTAYGRHVLPVGDGAELVLGSALALSEGTLHPGIRAGARWRAAGPLWLSATFSRTHQFAQSLRNAESVVGTIFPADLFVGAATPGVPVARSDQGVLALEYRPSAGFRVGVQGWLRRFDGLVLAAPVAAGPFADGAFVTGDGSAQGLAVDAALATARVGLVASWGLQDIEFAWGDSSFTPDHGTRQLFDAGATWFPTATTAVRLGVSGAIGRRTTVASGGFEWEACNLLDQGCEFGGSPGYGGDPLGGATTPDYFRVDAGVRQHWHLHLAGRDVQLALFATATNLLGRQNVLTFVRDPATGRVSPVEMRPTAPLVAGLDWRF